MRRFFGFCHNHLAALRAIISRYPVSPPQLSGNTPVANAFQPVYISLVKTLWYKFQITVAYRFHRRLCHLFHRYKPLLFCHRFYRRFTAVMRANGMLMVFDSRQQSCAVQILYKRFAACITVHPCIFSSVFIHRRVVVHNIQKR